LRLGRYENTNLIDRESGLPCHRAFDVEEPVPDGYVCGLLREV